ncbi:MAG: hypothetical protein QOJ39_2973, partial [Candidatus Eremiobacteraeota bacterium]|nr:hypothetical protein [Candidatus Eremiobacteraeota bacterium]
MEKLQVTRRLFVAGAAGAAVVLAPAGTSAET